MKMQIDERVQLRPATMDDLSAVVAMLNAWGNHYLGHNEFSEDELRGEWEYPLFSLAESSRLAYTPDGQVVGYAEVWDTSTIPAAIWVWVRVHPAFEGQGIGTRLMDWAEARARQAIPRVPEEARVIIRAAAPSVAEPSLRLLEDRGYVLARHFYEMRRDLDGPVEAPHWPDGLTLRHPVAGQDEWRAFHALRDSFRDHYGYIEQPLEVEFENWKKGIETDRTVDFDHWFLLMDGDEVAGFAYCWPTYDGNDDIGYVGQLGVRRPWRRRGLGRALLQQVFHHFQGMGKRQVALGVDADSITGAQKLYLDTGMHIHLRSDSYEFELRPGIDLMKRAGEE